MMKKIVDTMKEFVKKVANAYLDQIKALYEPLFELNVTPWM